MSCRAVLVSALLPIGTAACVAAHPGYSDITDYTETPSEYQLHAYSRAGEIKQDDLFLSSTPASPISMTSRSRNWPSKNRRISRSRTLRARPVPMRRSTIGG